MDRIKQTKEGVRAKGKMVTDALGFFGVDEFFPEHINQIRRKIREEIEPKVKTFILEDIENAQFPERAIPLIINSKIAFNYMKEPFGKGKCLKSLFAIILELSRIDASIATAYLVNFILFGNTIDDFGSEEQRAHFLPKLLNGEIMGGWGLTEPRYGSDASSLETSCKKLSDGRWSISGHKRWIGNGNKDFMIVFARDQDSKQVKGFIVNLTLPGIKREAIKHKMALRPVQNVDITFDNVVVEANMQMPGVKDFNDVNKMLAHSRISVAMLACGIGLGVYENTISYLSSRTQFKKRLTEFQLVQEKLVRMMGNIQGALLVTCKAVELSMAGKNTIGKLAMTKAWTTLRIREVAALGRELLGGNGIITDNYVMKAFCDMEAVYTYEGTYDINSLVAGRELTGFAAFK